MLSRHGQTILKLAAILILLNSAACRQKKKNATGTSHNSAVKAKIDEKEKEKNEKNEKNKNEKSGQLPKESMKADGSFRFESLLKPEEYAKPAQVDQHDELSFKQVVETHWEFFNEDPDDEGNQETSETCFDKAKAVADGDALIFDFRATQKDCPDYFPEAEFLVEVRSYMKCDGGDLSSFAGKSYMDFVGDGRLESLCEGTLRYVHQFRQTARWEEANGIGSSEILYVMNVSGPDGSPCQAQVKSPGVYGQNNCVTTRRHVAKYSDYPELNTDTWERFTYSNVTYADGERFYRSGKIDFEINSWAGTMTYSGADTDPTYVAAGPKGEQISGTFSGDLSAFGSMVDVEIDEYGESDGWADDGWYDDEEFVDVGPDSDASDGEFGSAE